MTEEATNAALEMAITACRKWLESRKAQYYNWAMNGSDGSTEGSERDAVNHCIQVIRALKGKECKPATEAVRDEVLKEILTDDFLSNAVYEAEKAGRDESYERYGVSHHCSPHWKVLREHIIRALKGKERQRSK